MAEKILFVDDDENVLMGYRRQLHKEFAVDTALGGEHGLSLLASQGPYPVIVADMRMPGMDGILFLSKVKETYPDSVRIMLTGNADQQTAINAINEGNIFRFLTKPCPQETMVKTLTAGIEQYRLVVAEKELLEQTLKGCVKVLTDVLTLVNPTAFGRASRVQRLVQAICSELKLENTWQTEVAAMLSQLGCITISEEILKKIYSGERLVVQELQAFQAHPQIGSALVSAIPRMEEVAEIIAYQGRQFDGYGMPQKRLDESGVPRDFKSGEDIPLGARILKLALDFDALTAAGMTNIKAYETIQGRTGWYDKAIVCTLKKLIAVDKGYEVRFVRANELAKNMTLAEDIKNSTGYLIAATGCEITPLLRIRLFNLAQSKEIREPIKVFVRTAANKDDGCIPDFLQLFTPACQQTGTVSQSSRLWYL